MRHYQQYLRDMRMSRRSKTMKSLHGLIFTQHQLSLTDHGCLSRQKPFQKEAITKNSGQRRVKLNRHEEQESCLRSHNQTSQIKSSSSSIHRPLQNPVWRIQTSDAEITRPRHNKMKTSASRYNYRNMNNRTDLTSSSCQRNGQ